MLKFILVFLEMYCLISERNVLYKILRIQSRTNKKSFICVLYIIKHSLINLNDIYSFVSVYFKEKLNLFF